MFDVIVVGAGPAGVVAAIQAGRLGMKTLLVEKNGTAGGMITVGGIPTPGSFYAYNRHLIEGIGWELCCRAQDEVNGWIPRPTEVELREGGTTHIRVVPAVFAGVCDEMLVEAGVEVLFHAMPASAGR
ncbi:MAG: FAD-dependent oxidoreductase, partial [Planctomycetota bacterium]